MIAKNGAPTTQPPPSGVVAARSATILVVHGDLARRDAVASLLEAAGHAVETFGAAHAFLAAAGSIQRGCAVIDLHLAGMGGLALQAELSKAGRTLPLVFVTGVGTMVDAVEAMKGGAVDVLLDGQADVALLDAIARALARDTEAEERRAALAALSPRERQVCERVAWGMLNKQIAAEFDISEAVVKQHRARGMKRLGVQSSAELARLLERAGR